MPFDGIEYGVLPLLRPFVHHPHAPSIPDVLAHGLRGGYMHGRVNGRWMGIQTYRHFLRVFGQYQVTNAYIYATSLVDLAAIEGYVPSWATHVAGVARFAIAGGAPANVSHRMTVTNGTNTDTGASVVKEVDAVTPNGLRQAQIYNLPEASAHHEASFFVALDAVRGSLPRDLDVRISGFAVDAENAAVRYLPGSYQAWWWAVG